MGEASRLFYFHAPVKQPNLRSIMVKPTSISKLQFCVLVTFSIYEPVLYFITLHRSAETGKKCENTTTTRKQFSFYRRIHLFHYGLISGTICGCGNWQLLGTLTSNCHQIRMSDCRSLQGKCHLSQKCYVKVKGFMFPSIEIMHGAVAFSFNEACLVEDHYPTNQHRTLKLKKHDHIRWSSNPPQSNLVFFGQCLPTT